MTEHAHRLDQGEGSSRFQRLREELVSAPIHLCPERATLITEYFRDLDDKSEPMVIRKAKAFRHLLSSKSATLFPEELIVGNVGSRRKSALIQPELASVFVSHDLFWIDKRKTTPFQISWPDRLKLSLRVLPYWLPRNMLVRAFSPRFDRLLRYSFEQLNAAYYLINEVGGIGHFLPDYEKMIRLGVEGYLESLEGRDLELHRAARIACEGLLEFSDRLAAEAERLARREGDAKRADELNEIARICRKVPRGPAETFHEALQSLWLTHLAVCLEGINSAVSFGRMDQYLYPFYHGDLREGRITPERARELLLCFSAKTTEHVFLVSEKASKYHGGFLIVQAAIVGGMDREGKDAVNELSYIFLDVMEESGLRDPNYQVRMHSGSPKAFVERAVDVARKGNGVPAFFSDEAVIAAMKAHGFPEEEARDYGIVGCVEPSLPGKSFLSTDAALFNLPLCLELALNRGRRLNGRVRIGAPTPDPCSFRSMEQVFEAFRTQVEYMVRRLIGDIQVIERGNRAYHPTPFSSMLVEGCIESGKDVTEGGALYNASGIQGVGIADTADSLAALDDVVFQRRRHSMKQVLDGMREDFSSSPELQTVLQGAPKFGNDHPLPDGYANQVARMFHDALSKYTNTRGGPYVSGFYSSTCHVGFGERTGALPSGRRAGEPFAASLGTANGRDRLGPTAVLNSVAKVDSALSPNGYALNLRFDAQTLSGDEGVPILSGLLGGFFKSGGMEAQLNVLDPDTLEDARENPGRYPDLVVRVAGYCAYFDDLPDAAKKEIIGRTRLRVDQ